MLRHGLLYSAIPVAICRLESHLPRVPPVALEVVAEPAILDNDSILADVRDKEDGQERGQDAKRSRDPEGILGLLVGVVTAGRNDVGENVGADKGAYLADCRHHAVVLAADARGASLGRDEADVVTRAEFAEGQKDAIDNREGGDVLGLRELAVQASHEVADHSLQGDSDGKRIAGPDPVGDWAAEHGAWDIKEVDDSVPAKGLVEGRISDNGIDDGGGVDPKRIRRKLG